MWFDILKKKGTITPTAIKYINRVMADGEKRTLREILDEIWNIIESYNILSQVERMKLTDIKNPTPLTGKGVPTTMELKSYLAKNNSSGIFHNETGEELLKTTRRRNVTKKYYR